MKSLNYAKTILVSDEGLVLLLRRSQNNHRRPGDWDLAGGEVNPGEELLVGATREIKEETGISVAPEKLRLVYAGTTEYPDSNITVNRLLFVAHVTEKDVVLSQYEHDDYKWVTVEQALKDFPHPFYSVGLEYAVKHSLL